MSSEWREQAACLGLDTEIFFPSQGTDSTPTQAICAGCPVRVECLAYAFSRCIRYGVWGGLTWRECCRLRRNLRRKGRRTAELAAPRALLEVGLGDP